MNRRAVALCGIGVAALAASTVGPAAGAGGGAAGPEPRLAAVTWKKCGTKEYPTQQCATLRVPLDHAHPRKRQIALALARIPHTAKRSQGPLLVNPGGPGGSGLTLAGFVAQSLPAKVAAQYDVVGFDPRGVGKSRPALDCVPGHFKPVRPASVPETAAIERANVRRAASFAQACGKKYADVLPFMDTGSTVRDMDAIRAALGARKLNYFGYSYGTYLGAVYAKYFPGRVRRLVLDSVVDPEGVWYQDNLTQDEAFNDRHRAFLSWVAKYDATYKLGKDPAKLESTWSAMRAALAKKPAGKKVGAAELEDTFLPGGYFNGYWPYLADAFAAYVKHKDPDPLVEAYENFAAPDATTDNNYSVYSAVQCRDAAWPRDGRQWQEDNARTHEKAPFSTWNNAWYNAPCAFWPTRSLRPPDVSNSALPPVLLFQATRDGATPYRGAVTMHRLLRGSSLVVEDGGGNHGVTLSGNACLDKHLAAYLASGTVPRGDGEADAVCKKPADPKPLKTKGAWSQGAALHRLLGTRG
ncbi:alpha/beta hydrolase [Streptomyces sp. NPDC049813]|uniref:alpha/beta hydrolase n=1 Tax=Streptomyces sp. NPDC049813 TaxID=3365597 RepID=UPI0037BDFDC4